MTLKRFQITSINSRIETRNSYNKMSSWYDVFASFENKYRKIGLQLLKPYDSQKILEIGFGTGKSLVKMLVDAKGLTEVFGVDLSDKMCVKTKQLLRKKSYNSFGNIICGDVTTIPWKDRSFDKILFSFTLELFDNKDIQIILDESMRILKENGKICIISLSRRKVNSMVKLYEWSHRKWPRIIDCKPIIAKSFLQQSKFQIITHTKKMMWGLPVDIILAEK